MHPPALGDVDEFVRSLRDMTAADLHRAANAIRIRRADPGDDLLWWEATLSIDDVLSRRRLSIAAAVASRLSGEAVTAAAAAHGLDLDHPDVVTVARRARQTARARVAGPAVARHLAYLLAGWWNDAPAAR